MQSREGVPIICRLLGVYDHGELVVMESGAVLGGTGGHGAHEGDVKPAQQRKGRYDSKGSFCTGAW